MLKMIYWLFVMSRQCWKNCDVWLIRSTWSCSAVCGPGGLHVCGFYLSLSLSDRGLQRPTLAVMRAMSSGGPTSPYTALAISRPAQFITHVELHRPDKLNAMNKAFWRQESVEINKALSISVSLFALQLANIVMFCVHKIILFPQQD